MSEQKKTKLNPTEIRIRILMIACGVLALALIVVSAFAYQWNNEKNDYKTKYQSAKALVDYNEIMTTNDEVGNLTMQVAALNSANEALQKTINEYETLLIENGLMEAETEAE